MTDILLAGLLVNLAAGVFLYLIVGKLEEWRKSRKYMIYLVGGILLVIAAGEILASRWITSVTLSFAPRRIQIPFPRFAMNVSSNNALSSSSSAVMFSLSLFTLCLAFSIFLPRLAGEPHFPDRTPIQNLAQRLTDAIVSFIFGTVSISLYKVTSFAISPPNRDRLPALFGLTIMFIVMIGFLYAMPLSRWKVNVIFSLTIGIAAFIFLCLLVIA